MPLHARSVLAYIEASKIDPAGFQDADDIHFAEVFITSAAQALISGNLRHFSPLLEQGLAVYNPAQFLDHFSPRNEWGLPLRGEFKSQGLQVKSNE